jgi:hypothetical protein
MAIVFLDKASGSKTREPISTRKKIIVAGEISSTAILIKR